MIMLRLLIVAFIYLYPVFSIAEEIIVKVASLPFAEMEQEIIYSSSEKQYNKERDEILSKLRNGDFSAMNNPRNGSTKIVQTTATIGISWEGIGVANGRKNLRRITAAEEALYLFEQ